ncbi:hypothetical protein ACIGHB_30125 [Streptomyces sp. NPDC085460]|uniref:hypothetical protein n=1 Tax=Streptomyces sp. NPDC085460 TaxID=3365723 RepID=UPI0037CE154C
MSVAMERLCDWVVNKDQVWVHGDRITDGHVALDLSAIAGLDASVVDKDGRWRIRKSRFPQWLGPDHPDLSDCLPFTGTDWAPVTWSNWSTGGARIGGVHGRAVAVRHDWLSRFEAGYRIECSPEHPLLRIVCETAVPALAYSAVSAQPAIVGSVVPVQVEASAAVLQAIVNEISS